MTDLSPSEETQAAGEALYVARPVADVPPGDGVESPRPRPWGFWGTIGWVALMFMATVVPTVVMVLIKAGEVIHTSGAEIDEALPQITDSGWFLAVVILITFVVVVAVAALAVRLKRWSFKEYLSLHKPTRRQVLWSLAGLAVLIVMQELLAFVAGVPSVPEFMRHSYRTAGSLPLLLLAFVIIAPLYEELVFRGFMYRGWEASIGPAATVILTTALFAVIHTQYDWVGMVGVGLFGLYAGLLRWRTGSTLLCFTVHAATNLVATVQVMVVVEFMQQA